VLRNDSDNNLHCADFHGNTEDSSYENCKIFGGVTWQGKNNGYKNCEIVGMPAGYLLLSGEIKGGLFYLDNCNVTTLARAQDNSRGHIDIGGQTDAITVNTVEDCTFRVLGGTYNLLNAGSGSHYVLAVNRGTAVNINFDIRPGEVNGDGLVSVLRTVLSSGTENSDYIEIGAIKGSLPRPITLRSAPSNEYINTPHKMPKSSGLETVTTDTGEKTTVGTPVLYPYVYPRTPHFSCGRSNRSAIGSYYGFPVATDVTITGLTMALRNEDSINWTAALTVDLSWSVTIDEL